MCFVITRFYAYELYPQRLCLKVNFAIANTGAAFGGFGAGDAGTQNVQSFVQAPIAEQTQSEPQKTGGIPNGLPRLSMLDSMERESGVGGGGEGFASSSSNSFGATEGNSSHPFYNGGSLPPEQTVDGADDEWLDTETPPEEDSYSAEEKNSSKATIDSPFYLAISSNTIRDAITEIDPDMSIRFETFEQ